MNMGEKVATYDIETLSEHFGRFLSSLGVTVPDIMSFLSNRYRGLMEEHRILLRGGIVIKMAKLWRLQTLAFASLNIEEDSIMLVFNENMFKVFQKLIRSNQLNYEDVERFLYYLFFHELLHILRGDVFVYVKEGFFRLLKKQLIREDEGDASELFTELFGGGPLPQALANMVCEKMEREYRDCYIKVKKLLMINEGMLIDE